MFPLQWRWLSWLWSTVTCTVRARTHTHTQIKHKMTHAATIAEWENQHQLLCAASMEDAELLHIHFHSTVLMTAAPPSHLLPVCWLCGGGEKTQEHIPVSLFFLSPHCNIHLLTAAGARESLSSCVSEHGCASKFPALFPAPSLSVEMLSLQTAHSFHHFVVTWSGPLPNKGDHLL